MSNIAGRTCPTGYRYGPVALALAPERAVDTLYVVGGVYGNLPALEAIEEMAHGEQGPVQLCFNGDFNWFNVDDDGFRAVNQRVFQHDAILGNVEAELLEPDSVSGCGCAYPDNVDDQVVERSNRIHARLKATAHRHPSVIRGLSALPMFRRYRVGDIRVGVVHGDAESLAGWRFDVAALDDIASHSWLVDAFTNADVDIFASTHTCLPALRRFEFAGEGRFVINNGAAGMPNFQGVRCGLMTRISIFPSRQRPLYGLQYDGIHVDAVPIGYDRSVWLQQFQANWPDGSSAHSSYFSRIVGGPNYTIGQAAPKQ